MSTSISITHTHRSSLIEAMSSNTQTLVQSPSTAGAAAAALKLYNICRRRKEKSLFSDMLFSEIVSTNLEDELLNYSSWWYSTPIPIYFTKNCSRVLEGTTKMAQFDSWCRLRFQSKFGRIIFQTRRKFPQHPDFSDLCTEEVPQWCTKLRPLFETQCIRFSLPPWERLYVWRNIYALAIPVQQKWK